MTYLYWVGLFGGASPILLSSGNHIRHPASTTPDASEKENYITKKSKQNKPVQHVFSNFAKISPKILKQPFKAFRNQWRRSSSAQNSDEQETDLLPTIPSNTPVTDKISNSPNLKSLPASIARQRIHEHDVTQDQGYGHGGPKESVPIILPATVVTETMPGPVVRGRSTSAESGQSTESTVTSGSTTGAGSKETLLTSSYDTLPSLGTNFSNNKGETIQHNPHCCEPQEMGIVGHQDRLRDELAETVAPPPRLEHEESFKDSSQSDDEESKSGAIELMKRGDISRPSQFLSKDWEHKKQRLPDISLAIKLHDDEGHTYTFWPSTKLCELSHDEHLISGGAILAQEKMRTCTRHRV